MLRLNAVHLAVCLLPLALAGCGEPADHDDPHAAAAGPGGDSRAREASSRAFTGVVVARTQSDLGFRASGKILARLVETGQSVKRGQLLLRLDPADLTLQAQSQQRAVDAARARAKGDQRSGPLSRPRWRAAPSRPRNSTRLTAAEAASRPERGQAQANVAQNAYRLCRTAGGR